MIYYFINMTAEEYFCAILIGIIITGVIIGIIEAICDRIERRLEKKRRALKRYDAAIRPTRRY